MHHISADRRSKASLTLIRSAFYDLVAERGLDAVTISAISERAGVGRSTFYRLFDNPDDILLHDVDQAIAAMADHMLRWVSERGIVSERDALARQFAFWLRQSELLDHLETCHQMAYLTSRVTRFVRQYLGNFIASIDLDAHEAEYLVQTRAATFTIMLQVARHRFPGDDADDLAHIMTRLSGDRSVTWTAGELETAHPGRGGGPSQAAPSDSSGQ